MPIGLELLSIEACVRCRLTKKKEGGEEGGGH